MSEQITPHQIFVLACRQIVEAADASEEIPVHTYNWRVHQVLLTGQKVMLENIDELSQFVSLESVNDIFHQWLREREHE